MPDSIALYVHGATEAEIARGEAAARSVLEQAGRAPFAAATAFGEIELADEMGMLNDERAAFDDVGIAAWLEAFPAAVRTCCEGWSGEPIYTNFIVRPEGEPPLPNNAAVTAEIDRMMALPDTELRHLWAAHPDSSDLLTSLVYWAASERELNGFAAGGTVELVDA